jgi:hypothetical protein
MQRDSSNGKTRRTPSVRLTHTWTGTEEPPLSPKAIRQLEDGLVKWLKDSDFAELAQCDASVCVGVVHEIKRFLGQFGFDLTCEHSKCTWVFDRDKGGWIRMCSVDCAEGGYRLMGSATAD